VALDNTAAQPYWPALDGLRAVAIVSVMVFHASNVTLPGGGSGVDVFFVLSGFLITTLLLREQARTGRIALGRFYGRRALRLLPALFAVVAVVVIVFHLSPMGYGSEAAPARSSLLYYADLRASAHQPMGLLLPMWSLSLEEQFYVLWPTVLFGLLAAGASRRQLLIGTGAAFVALTTWHWLAGEAHLANLQQLLYRPDLRANGLVLGCFVGVWFASPPQLTARVRGVLQAGAWTGAAVLALAFWKGLLVAQPARGTLLVPSIVVATAALIASQVAAPVGAITAVLANPVARWIGRLSYSLYLVHVPVLGASEYLLRGSPWATKMTVYAAGSLAAACLLHWAVERPFLRLKQRRLEPDGVSANTAAAAALTG